MQIFGYEFLVRKAAIPRTTGVVTSGWWQSIFDSSTGYWQQHVEVDQDSVIAQSTVFSCVTLISGDIGKLRPTLVRKDGGIWSETSSPAFSPVLAKPNHFQNWNQFVEQWLISKLLHGNTYVLKARDNRGVVTGMYALDPTRVKVLVAPNGDVYYNLSQDNLSGLEQEVTVPATEIIHDRWNALYHPLVGLSPIFACGVAATQGLAIQSNSTKLFSNGSRPGGVLTAPGAISQETADRLKAAWDSNYSGDNYGKTAVLGDGLTYAPTAVTAADAQLIEQLKWAAEQICACYHVPGYKVGVGAVPTYNNISALAQEYYQTCLQTLIEALERCLVDGLGLDTPKQGIVYGIRLDLDGLLRMDVPTQMTTLAEGLKGGVLFTNEARAKLDLPPVDGGNVIFRQAQDIPLHILAEGPQKPIVAPAIASEPAPESKPIDEVPEDEAKAFLTRSASRIAWKRAA